MICQKRPKLVPEITQKVSILEKLSLSKKFVFFSSLQNGVITFLVSLGTTELSSSTSLF